MIVYEPKDWLKVMCSVRGTVISQVMERLWWIVLIAVGIWALREWVPMAEPVFRPFKPIGHTLLGLALGLLIVFHNNCAYDRYWEGRKLWGAIVNTSRNLIRGTTIYAGPAPDMADYVAAYAFALKQHLRNDKDLSELKELVSPAVLDELAATANPPSLLAVRMSRWILDRQNNGKIDTVTAQSLESLVRLLLDNQGGCERILRTPIPFAYAVHIKQMLTLYLITLPFALVGEMGWVAIPATAVIAFGMIGIEVAGTEIEDPFGTDPNDLPLEAICATIQRDAKILAVA
ncbi:bestrophin family protein [Zavarzinella formosa]|uniref:bestrophin family protein n=1 Tax=Zavarzinella formosa TaxID=360055 RepID=UPI0002DC2FC2|nr:bestrophin family ion channel [Zavarzinella formosa]